MTALWKQREDARQKVIDRVGRITEAMTQSELRAYAIRLADSLACELTLSQLESWERTLELSEKFYIEKNIGDDPADYCAAGEGA